MSEESKNNTGRRTAIKSVLVGGAAIGASKAPDSWHKPVISSVMLPVHAGTTQGGGEPDMGTTPTPTTLVPGTMPPLTDNPGEPTPSDLNIKENFHKVDKEAILEGVVNIPITEWNYKSDDDSVRHIGPMAQDFKAEFGVGDSDKHIHAVDMNGVSIAAIQALYAKLEERDRRIEELEKQIHELAEKLS